MALLLALLLGLVAGTVRADGSAGSAVALSGYDYSRFSDGPRRVPRPRGVALQRATALGLGTREVASRLLRARPEPRWVEAARGAVGDRLEWPVALGRFGRGFGFVRTTRPDKRHDGVDVVAAEGSVVRAAADGIVAYGDNGVRGFGNLVILVHPNGWVTTYAHLYRVTVQPGWRVRRGERIGFVGNTGISRGPHLHFELHVEGRAVDPLPYFEGRPWVDAYREWRRRREEGTDEPSLDYAATDLAPDVPTAPQARVETTKAAVASTADRAPRDAASTAAPAADAAPLDAASTAAPAAEAAPLEGVGTTTLARALLDAGPTAEQMEAVAGPLYSTLLWPARGGALARRAASGRRGLTIEAEAGTPVRAAADGLVVYVGEGLRGVGLAVVLLHRNGWVTVYGSAERVHVEPGRQVRRGEWIAEVGTSAGGAAHLHFQVRHRGDALDPLPLLVQVPRG